MKRENTEQLAPYPVALMRAESQRRRPKVFDDECIPDGDMCDGCPYCMEKTINLVDMFGNETGNTRIDGYCFRFDTSLVPANNQCCCGGGYEKNFYCVGRNLSDEEKAVQFAILLAAVLGTDRLEQLKSLLERGPTKHVNRPI